MRIIPYSLVDDSSFNTIKFSDSKVKDYIFTMQIDNFVANGLIFGDVTHIVKVEIFYFRMNYDSLSSLFSLRPNDGSTLIISAAPIVNKQQIMVQMKKF